jgi:excisionase family DNA binding protein
MRWSLGGRHPLSYRGAPGPLLGCTARNAGHVVRPTQSPDPVAALAEALAAVVRQAVHEAVVEVAESGGDTAGLVGIPEVARRMALGTTTVKRLIAAGELRSLLVGRRRLVPPEAIEEFRRKATA